MFFRFTRELKGDLLLSDERKYTLPLDIHEHNKKEREEIKIMDSSIPKRKNAKLLKRSSSNKTLKEAGFDDLSLFSDEKFREKLALSAKQHNYNLSQILNLNMNELGNLDLEFEDLGLLDQIADDKLDSRGKEGNEDNYQMKDNQ